MSSDRSGKKSSPKKERIARAPPPRRRPKKEKEKVIRVRSSPAVSRSGPRAPSLKVLKPLFSALESTDGVPAGFTTGVRREFQITGDMHNQLAITFTEPLCLIAAPMGAPGIAPFGALLADGSVNGTSTQPNTWYTLGLSPLRLPGYGTSGSGPVEFCGVAFADATFLANLALSFGKYRVTGDITLHYKPLVSTTDGYNFVLGLSCDGAHPVTGVSQNPAIPFPSQGSLDNGNSSISWASWMPWSVSFPVDNTEKYTYFVPTYTGILPPTYYPEADIRQALFGSMSCLANGASGSSTVTVTKGQLYWSYRVIFSDPWPTSTIVRSLTSLTSELLLRDGPRPSLTGEPTELKGVPPARFVRMRGAAAGFMPDPPDDDDDVPVDPSVLGVLRKKTSSSKGNVS